jgi:hypothetical protein
MQVSSNRNVDANVGGLSVYQIVGSVFGLNILLLGLAAITLLRTSPALHVTMLAAGWAIVGTLLWNFNYDHR